MPHSVPARIHDPARTDSLPDAAPPLRHHRRSSRVAPAPGAFTPLSNLPRRHKSQRTFQFHPDSDSSDDLDDAHTNGHSNDHSNGARPSLETSGVRLTPPGIPFPSRDQFPPPPPLIRSPSAGAVVRLASGKPLRPSLKSSLSAPQFPLHLRSHSAPTTPSGLESEDCSPPVPLPHKNVHFQDDAHLASVRLFRIAGKPVNISRREDETETETDDPGPVSDNHPLSSALSYASSPLALAPPPISSPIPPPPPPSLVPTSPPPHPSAFSLVPYILLVACDLTTDDDAPAVIGTLIIRNIAYEKHVSVRFTLDDWRTTSEVSAYYTGPGSLPQGWHIDDFPYDTFKFRIVLHALHRPQSRILFLAIRLNAAGGEWWDNNFGRNYKVGFRAGPPIRVPHPFSGRSLSSPPAPPPHVRPEQKKPPISMPNGHSSSVSNNYLLTPTSPVRDLSSISRGTGFSSYSLPQTPTPPPPAASAAPPSPKLTLRNYAPPQQSPKAMDNSLPTPPSSRSSSISEPPLSSWIIGGHRATLGAGVGAEFPAPEETVMPARAARPSSNPRLSSPTTESGLSTDSYAALLARWCFATGDTDVTVPRSALEPRDHHAFGDSSDIKGNTGTRSEAGWV